MSDELRQVHLLVLDRSGKSLLVDVSGELPSFRIQLRDEETTVLATCRLILPELGLDGPIIDCYLDQTAHDDEGAGRVPALIELAAPADGWTMPDRWRWISLSEAQPTIERGVPTYLSQLLDERRGVRPVPVLRALWSRAGWYERACAWIDQALDDGGRPPATAVAQVRHWGISAVMRVDTASGRCWFKAVFPHFRQEAAITAFLDRERPGFVAPVIAVDVAEGWLLLDDVGSDTLARSPQPHPTAIGHLVALQRSFASRTDELVAAGCPRRSLVTLPNAFARSVTTSAIRPWLDLSSARVSQLVDWLADAVAAIDALAVPDTLVHGDFHPGNVAMWNGQPIIFDWSDAAISHPLVDVVTWAQWIRDDVEALDALWTMFLEAWDGVIPVAWFAERRSTFEAVAGAYHVTSYTGILTGLEPHRRPEHADGLTQFFALLDSAVPA